jgi:hypothetical protein
MKDDSPEHGAIRPKRIWISVFSQRAQRISPFAAASYHYTRRAAVRTLRSGPWSVEVSFLGIDTYMRPASVLHRLPRQKRGSDHEDRLPDVGAAHILLGLG